jgi:two-component system alkaline phosphatase synthesis response regulator PhoP
MPIILVVEDELPISEIISTILSSVDYQVLVARNGQEALVCLDEGERPDLILSDIMMPVMDGRELCKKLQAHPGHSSIPVILMSTALTSINLDGCKHSAFLKKPFAVDELLSKVSNTISEGQTSS